MSDVLADGTIFAGDFRVIRVIHAGGLSTLYEVEQVSTGVRRALKVVAGALGKDEKLRELFLEEAKRVGRIQSDHVAELLSCGVDASTDLPFAILELVQGETLAEHGASVYLGDTTSDMSGARVADAFAIGVTTGPHDSDELTVAGEGR